MPASRGPGKAPGSEKRARIKLAVEMDLSSESRARTRTFVSRRSGRQCSQSSRGWLLDALILEAGGHVDRAKRAKSRASSSTEPRKRPRGRGKYTFACRHLRDAATKGVQTPVPADAASVGTPSQQTKSSSWAPRPGSRARSIPRARPDVRHLCDVDALAARRAGSNLLLSATRTV